MYANPLTWHGSRSKRFCLISDDDDSAILLQNSVEFTSKGVDTKSCSVDRCTNSFEIIHSSMRLYL